MSPTARPRPAQDVVASAQAHELVLLHAATGQYYTLDDVGARVWELCDGSRSVAEIVGLVHGEYDAPLATIQADVQGLLDELAAQQLVADGVPARA